ncbi:GntR family transcriptional regulator [soil metagenome]
MNDADLIARLHEAISGTRRRPLFEQLAAAVLAEIESGSLFVGDKLPHEPELAKELGVSRETVNQALTSLARRGYLRRRRGIGTFVATPDIEQPLNRLYTFIRAVTAQQHVPGVRMLGTGLAIDAEASRALDLERNSPLFRIGRLRTIDDEPFIIEHFFVAPELGQALQAERLAAGEPIYDLLLEATGLQINRGVEMVRAVVLQSNECAQLGVPNGSPGFEVLRNGFAGPRKIEFRRSVIRGDRYQFRIDLEGDSLDERA